jgi:hypothetical protein
MTCHNAERNKTVANPEERFLAQGSFAIKGKLEGKLNGHDLRGNTRGVLPNNPKSSVVERCYESRAG